MTYRSILRGILLFASTQIFAQSKLLLSPNLRLSKDSISNKQLLKDLDGFLSQLAKENNENTFVLKEDLLETSLLMDEIKDNEASGKYKNKNFYKPYLSNLTRSNDTTFYIQLSYLGVADSMPILRASFNLLALKKKSGFYFASPLKFNPVIWKSQQIGNYIFKFRTEFSAAKAKQYVNMVSFFDHQLNVESKPVIFYCCNNFPEALQMAGVSYKSDYNGIYRNTLSADENNRSLVINGAFIPDTFKFDPHDLWHSRLHKAVSTDSINKPVDEGCAYLYGGSWGLSWETILALFKKKVASDPQADWLALYNEGKSFENKDQPHLIAGYVINALLVKKIEKEKGFPAVMALLKCGKYEKGNDNYFKALEKITGISKAGFNENVWKLIKES